MRLSTWLVLYGLVALRLLLVLRMLRRGAVPAPEAAIFARLRTDRWKYDPHRTRQLVVQALSEITPPPPATYAGPRQELLDLQALRAWLVERSTLIREARTAVLVGRPPGMPVMATARQLNAQAFRVYDRILDVDAQIASRRP